MADIASARISPGLLINMVKQAAKSRKCRPAGDPIIASLQACED